MMVVYIEKQVTPSPYYVHKADVALLSDRPRRDAQLENEITRVWNENFRAYGAYKVWKQLNREGTRVARCTVERLMRTRGIRGVIQSKSYRTRVSGLGAERPADLVKRTFTATASYRLWAADITFVASGGVRYTSPS